MGEGERHLFLRNWLTSLWKPQSLKSVGQAGKLATQAEF